VEIRVKVDTTAFAQFVQRMRDELQVSTPGPYSDGMLAASDVYHEEMRNRFEAASARDGTWQPLAPSTAAAHKRIGDDPYHILHMWGNLEVSLRRNAPDHILETTLFAVIEGTENFTAGFHQHGTTTAPARRILVDPDALTLIEMGERIAEGLQATVNGASLAVTFQG
jgi:Phage virion morphogenesis family